MESLELVFYELDDEHFQLYYRVTRVQFHSTGNCLIISINCSIFATKRPCLRQRTLDNTGEGCAKGVQGRREGLSLARVAAHRPTQLT